MAIKPSPDRSDLESKTREDLQTIAKVKGVDTPTRATKAALIEAIMGDPPSTSDSSTATTHGGLRVSRRSLSPDRGDPRR